VSVSLDTALEKRSGAIALGAVACNDEVGLVEMLIDIRLLKEIERDDRAASQKRAEG
jgi:hypothetical protein